MNDFASSSPAPESDRFARFALALALAAAIARAVPALVASLWLDETATWWLIDGGWSGLLERWRAWPYQSFVHGAVALAAKQAISPAEWALRLPSVAAAVAVLLLVHRLARRFVGAAGAAAALLVLLGSRSVFFAATTARPYALGLLALVLSWWALERWDATGRAPYLFAWATGSALVGYCQFTLLFGLLAQLPFAVHRLRRASGRERRQFALAAGVALAAGLPILGALATAVRLAPRLDFSPEVRFETLFTALAPPLLASALLAALATALATRTWPFVEPLPPSPRVVRLAVPLWSVPIVAPFLADVLGLAPLFVGRYLLAADLGLALLVGVAVDRCRPRLARRAALALLAIAAPVTMVTPHWPLYDGFDWRTAAAASRRLAAPAELVLAPSGFVESLDPRAFAELESIGRLSAPLVAYPLQGEVVALPLVPNRPARLFVARRLEQTEISRRARFHLLHPNGGPWLPWLLEEHPEFRLATRTVAGRLDWLVFERRQGDAALSSRR